MHLSSFLLSLLKMEPLPAANTQFSLNLFKKISEGDASGNVFYSPISISSALAMVSLGAKENTAAQMFKVISHNLNFCSYFNWERVKRKWIETEGEDQEVTQAFCTKDF